MSIHSIKTKIKRVVPQKVYRPVVTRWRRLNSGAWNGERRLTPFSEMSGLDRGKPIDRYYIENFLKKYENDIRGDVAEIMDSAYSRQFGGDRVTRFHVLDIDPKNTQASLICNLETGEGVEENTYDCFIVTQTYCSTYRVKEAIENSYRLLKPGGVLLATVPGIAKILRFAYEDYGEYWRFTSLSIRRLFEEIFPSSHITVEAGGNVFTTTAFLYGMVVEEMTKEELEYNDRDYELILTIRAVKPD
jgi:SAM-dependent methyltransferase